MYSTWYHFCLSKQFTSLLPLHIYEFIYTLVGTPQSFLISSSNLAFFFLPQILNLWLIPSYSNPLFVSLFYNTLFLSHLMSRLHSLSPSLTTLSTSSFWYLSLSCLSLFSLSFRQHSSLISHIFHRYLFFMFKSQYTFYEVSLSLSFSFLVSLSISLSFWVSFFLSFDLFIYVSFTASFLFLLFSLSVLLFPSVDLASKFVWSSARSRPKSLKWSQKFVDWRHSMKPTRRRRRCCCCYRCCCRWGCFSPKLILKVHFQSVSSIESNVGFHNCTQAGGDGSFGGVTLDPVPR